MLKIFLIILGLNTCLFYSAYSQNLLVNVANFGAQPNDGKCDIAAIKKALEHARNVKASDLIFDAGVYDLFVGDAAKNTAIDIELFFDFTMNGAIDKKGNPATTFLRHYNFRNSLNARPILHVSNSKNFSVKNLIFDNNPRYSTAGEVIANDGQSITVKIFEGNPMIDGVIFYTGNVWDLSTKNLKKQASITYGSDVDKKKKEYTWRVIGDTKNRVMKLNSPNAASKVTVGDGISWSFSWQGKQVVFESCKDLLVENVWTYNAIGFAMEAKGCENIIGRKVKVIAPGNQLLVTPRDGWKLFANRGNVLMDQIYMEGARWDGQNVHGSFMWPYQVVDKNKIWLMKKGGTIFPIPSGSKIGLWKGDKEIIVTVEKAEPKITHQKKEGFVITLKETVPDFVNEKTLCQLYGWNIDNYKLSNSVFKNIAGTASLIRNTNVTIVNNTFDHIMYTAVVIGAAIRQGEGLVPENVRIENNVITNSGWIPRFKTRGAIGVRNQREDEAPDTREPLRNNKRKHVLSPLIRNVQIVGNIIKDCTEGIVADETSGLHIEKNRFFNVKNPIDVHPNYNYGVRLSKNEIK